MDPTVQVDTWKAKVAADKATEVQEEMLAWIQETRSHTVQGLQLIFHGEAMPEEKTKAPKVKVQKARLLGVFILLFPFCTFILLYCCPTVSCFYFSFPHTTTDVIRPG